MSSFSCVLVAANSSYSHTNPAVRILHNLAQECGFVTPIVLEVQTKEPLWKIAEAILCCKPAMIGLSFYIWNRDYLFALASMLKKIQPSIAIVAGGPEISFEPPSPLFDAVICGEGEEKWLDLLLSFRDAGGAVSDCDAGQILRTIRKSWWLDASRVATCEPIFAYLEDDFAGLRDRIVYLETSRGCPFSCAFCLSGREDARFREWSGYSPEGLASLARRLSAAGVRRIKFLDRTFNTKIERALQYFRALSTCRESGFHFEISASLLNAVTLDFLSTIEPGQFQFEIGVQSLHLQTLKRIGRVENPESLLEVITRLVVAGRVHVHVDLIAGLPEEGFSEFLAGFDRLYQTGAQEIQLGFLKKLAGAPLAQFEGVGEFSAAPPYEVLTTPWLSGAEIICLKSFENVFDLYYNSGRFRRTLAYLLQTTEWTPAALYLQIAKIFSAKGHFLKCATPEWLSEILLEIFPKFPLLRDYLLLDYVTSARVYALPRALRSEYGIPLQLRKTLQAKEDLLVPFEHQISEDCAGFSLEPGPSWVRVTYCIDKGYFRQIELKHLHWNEGIL